MKNLLSISGYKYESSQSGCAHEYLLPTVRAELALIRTNMSPSPRLFDLGCGNGSVLAQMAIDGWECAGVDPSIEGVTHARRA
jgi:2-polyprenyl-6-hydroxyphenyl methylase/3-demethylubiquinone-9 3-methyltransferase